VRSTSRGTVPNRSVQRFLAIIAAFGIFVLAVIVLKRAVDLPYWDEWDWAVLVYASHHHSLTFAKLWEPHNEHRILVANLLTRGLDRFGGWSPIREQLIALALLALTQLGVWISRAPDRLGGLPRRLLSGRERPAAGARPVPKPRRPQPSSILRRCSRTGCATPASAAADLSRGALLRLVRVPGTHATLLALAGVLTLAAVTAAVVLERQAVSTLVLLAYLWAGSIALSAARIDVAVLDPAGAGPRYFFYPRPRSMVLHPPSVRRAARSGAGGGDCLRRDRDARQPPGPAADARRSALDESSQGTRGRMDQA